MTKKIKKLLSVMMVIALMVMYLPKSESVFAAGEPDAPLNFTSVDTPASGTGYEWVEEDKTLTINGLNMNTDNKTAITLPADSTIDMNDNGTIKSKTCCIKCEGNLTIKGAYELVCECGNSVVNASGDINIDGACLKATTDDQYAHTIEAKNINVSNNGTLFALKALGVSNEYAGIYSLVNIDVTSGLVINYNKTKCEVHAGYDGEKTISNILTDTDVDVSRVSKLNIYKGTLNVDQTPSGQIKIYDGTIVKNTTVDTINIYDSELSGEIAIPASESYTSVTPPSYHTLTSTAEKAMTESGISFEGNVATDGEFANSGNDCLGKTQLYKITGLTVGKCYDFKLIQSNSTDEGADEASVFIIMNNITGDFDNDCVKSVCSSCSSDTSYTATQNDVYVMIYNHYDFNNAPFTFTVNEKIYDTVSSSDNGNIYIKGTQNEDDRVSLKYLLSETEPTTWENAKTIDENNPLYGTGTLNKDIIFSLSGFHKNNNDMYPNVFLYVKDLDLGTGKIISNDYNTFIQLHGNTIKTAGIEANYILIWIKNCEIKDVTAKKLCFRNVSSATLTGNINCDEFEFGSYCDDESNLYLTISPTAFVECDKVQFTGNITNKGKFLINNVISSTMRIYCEKIINEGTFINRKDIECNVNFSIENTGLFVNDGEMSKTDACGNKIYKDDCTLSDLTVNSGSLVPAFDRENGCYTMNVGEDVDSIKLTPTLNSTDENSILKINGEVVASGSESQAINLETGENTIKVTISVDDFTNTYKLVVTRGNPTPDTDTDTTPTSSYTPDPHNKETTTEKISEIAKNLEDGDKLTIKPTTETKSVKGNVLKEIKGKDVEVKVEVADGIEWSFNGKDIPENWNAKDINFGVDTEKSNIPTEILKTFTSGKKSKTLSLDYDGAFGFEMKLSVHIGYFNEGQYANIYYYNPTTKELEFMGSSKINSAGNAKFDFKHASDYVILVSDKAATALDNVDTTTSTADDTTTDTSESNPITGNEMQISIVILSLGAIAIVTKKKFVK